MNISLNDLSATSIYHLMTQSIIPRPIAWVLSSCSQLTSDNTASLNLAPFSYFNAISSDPPLMILSMGKKPDGSQKDTATNLSIGSHCVVHIAHAKQAEQVTDTAATLEYGVSEVAVNNIELVSHENWPIKRIAACPIAYLCKVHSTQQIGNTPQQLIFVEALELYVDDRAIKEEKGRVTIDAMQVDPLSRLGANQYAHLAGVISKNRPK